MSDQQVHVLFLCVANSARSQMAEGWGRALLGDEAKISSAGSSPRGVNPYAVRVMDEVGIDLTGHTSDAVDAVDPAGVSHVVTLCEEEVCPVFLGDAVRLHWPLSDPDRKDPSLPDAVCMGHFREARDAIRALIEENRAVLLRR